MPDEKAPVAKKSVAKRGPGRPRRKTEAELREELRAEMRAEMKAELASMREEVEAEVRAKVKSESDTGANYTPNYDIAVDLDDDGALTIHFIEDGLNGWGKIWYRGEELTIKPGSREWLAETDRNGFAWFTLTESEQLDRYGTVRWRRGPWKGRAYDLNDPNLSEEDRQRLMSIQRERDQRNRRES